MKFEIKARLTGAVMFTAELDATFETKSQAAQLGAAVRVAMKSGADLGGANLRGANLGRANLRDAYLVGADLVGANLGRANLVGANLVGANLVGANLGWADLGGADLVGADLRDAYLVGAYLGGDNLVGANLVGANLVGANLVGADLRGADLGGAYLVGAYLGGAYLGGGVKAVRLIARVTRILDPYEFLAWRVEDGRCLIYAGCRRGWTVEQFVAHSATYTDKAKRDETLAILEFIENSDRRDAAASTGAP